MILEPDMLDHWKTNLLCGLLDDPYAFRFPIRLWCHCQQRKTDLVPKDAKILKAICRYEGDADSFLEAMKNTFLDEETDHFRAHDFRKVNAQLFANWENGKLGGRKKKGISPKEKTQIKPNGNPPDNQTEIWVNPSAPDKIGLDKIGLDKSTPSSPPGEDLDILLGRYKAIFGHKESTSTPAMERAWKNALKRGAPVSQVIELVEWWYAKRENPPSEIFYQTRTKFSTLLNNLEEDVEGIRRAADELENKKKPRAVNVFTGMSEGEDDFYSVQG